VSVFVPPIMTEAKGIVYSVKLGATNGWHGTAVLQMLKISCCVNALVMRSGPDVQRIETLMKVVIAKGHDHRLNVRETWKQCCDSRTGFR